MPDLISPRKKRLLIISPYFPPTNAADMQRVRMSLPYFRDFGWEPEVVAVALQHSDMTIDPLLTKSVPKDIVIHYVNALPKRWTAKIGLGSIALRSFLFYRRKVSQLLKAKKYDLVYFSTTQFPVCVLGAYWKKQFGVPYVIDMQDPWHSEYYEENPTEKRPAKYWFSYRLNKKLEPIAMKTVDGLIAVSEGYLQTLDKRYTRCNQVPQQTITFGAFATDFQIAREHAAEMPSVLAKDNQQIKIVYVGRGGKDMLEAVSRLFGTFQTGLAKDPQVFERFHFYFIGTSYAAAGQGIPTIAPLAKQMGIEAYVTEVTDRIPFYQTLNTLADASALFVPGSTDPQYTASKIYPYVLAQKPMLAYFHPASSVVSFLRSSGAGTVLTFDQNASAVEEKMLSFLTDVAYERLVSAPADHTVIERYSARTMTQKQCELFQAVTR